MENPATWTPAQKAINEALYEPSHTTPEARAAAALKVQIPNPDPKLVADVAQIIADYEQALATGFCGASLSRKVLDHIQNLG